MSTTLNRASTGSCSGLLGEWDFPPLYTSRYLEFHEQECKMGFFCAKIFKKLNISNNAIFDGFLKKKKGFLAFSLSEV